MADQFTPSKNVPDVRGTPAVPTVQRNVKVQETSTPEFQSSFQKFAESQNTLSAIGASVAQSASNQMAKQLGYEEGKNPHGNLTPSFTEFDKTFEESYNTQAHATLTLQGEKLLTDAQVQMAQSQRLTPDLIAKTQNQLQTGLAKISAQAPVQVRSQLEASFGSQVLNQTTQYKEKMIREQRQDQADTLKNGMHVNIQNAYELASKGDFKGSLRAVDAASKYATNGHNNRYLTPDEARVAKETAWQSHLNGRYIFGATEAYKQSKLPEYLKVLSEDRQGMTNEQYLAVGQAVNQQINFLQGLRSQEQNIQAVKFEEEIAQNPNIIPATRITELKSQVSPLQYEKLQLEYIKAKRKFNAEQAGSDLLINGFSNNEVFPRGTPEQKNKAFDTIVSNYIQNNPNLGRDEAEAQVAASAAGAVPGYVHVLNAKLGSANPVDIESAGKSIAYMYQRQKGANLEGLNDQSVAMYNMYQSLRRSKIPQEAAQEAYKAVYNQTPDEKKIVEDTWADQIRTIKNDHGKISYFTDLGGVDKSDLVDPLGYVEQAESMLHANFALTKGDLETAKTMTSEALKNTYGQSYVNGKKQTVFMPLENVIGIPHDGIGFIQDDVIESVNNQLASTKAAFDAGSLPYYWEVEPRHTVQSAKNPKHNLTGNFLAFSNPDITTAVNKQTQAETESGSEMRIFKHWKNGTRETFPLIIKADPWLSKANNQMKPYTAGWDIVLGTPNGYTPLYRENPMMGQFVVYKPDVQKIRSAYVNKNLVPSGGW